MKNSRHAFMWLAQRAKYGIAMLAACCISGCVSGPPMQLSELRQIQIDTFATNNTTILEMAGTLVSSPFAVGPAKLKKTPDNVLLILIKTKFLQTINGAVDVRIQIPDDAEAVAFGDRDCIIWRRAEDGGRNTSKFYNQEWDFFCAEVTRDIQHELAGKPPPSAHQTWPEYWESLISKIEVMDFRLLPTKRIVFINTQRQKAGLPSVQ